MFGEAALSYKDTMRRQCRQSGDTHVAEMHGTAKAAFNAAQSTVFPDRMGRNDTFMAIVVSLLFALVVGGLTMLRGGAQPKQRSAGSKDGLKPREDWHAQ